MIHRILKFIAPKSFNDGLRKCNKAGMALVKKTRIERFLDVGCGDGELTRQFAEYLGARKMFGIEYIDEVRKKAEERGIECVKADLNGRWPFASDNFNLILSSQNIEHVHNSRLYLEECYRCLKPGGQLLVLTENLSSWINIGASLLGWQPFSTTNINGLSIGNPLIWHLNEQKDKQLLERYQDLGISGTVGHVRVLAYRGLKDLMIHAGFQGVALRTTGYLPLWGFLSDILCKVDKIHGHFLVATGFKNPDID